jgi:hypothetical protein
MLELNTCQDAETAAQSLQLHFFSSPTRELSSCIPPDFVTRALMLVLYLLPYMKPHKEPYVRSKLDIEVYIEAPILSQQVQEAMNRPVSAEARYAVLEHDLRVVVALLRDAQTLTSTQLEYIGMLLQPLWDHYQSTLELQRFLLQSARTTHPR